MNAEISGKAIEKSYFKKPLILFLEIMAVLITTAIILVILLFWRLQQGPVDVNFLTKPIEDTINKHSKDFEIDLRKTEMSWNSYAHPFQLELHGVKVLRKDKTPVLFISRSGIVISKTQLLNGRVSPSEITLYDLLLKTIRQEDGKVTFNINSDKYDNQEIKDEDVKDLSNVDHTEIIKKLISGLEGNKDNPLYGLKRVNVKNGVMFLEDKKTNTNWHSKNIDFTVKRKDKNLIGRMGTDLLIKDNEYSKFDIQFFYNWQMGNIDTVTKFTDVKFGNLVNSLPNQEFLKKTTAAFTGRFEASFDRNMNPKYISIDVNTGKGNLAVPLVYDDGIYVDKARLKASIGGIDNNIKIEELSFSAKNASLNFNGIIDDGKDSLYLSLNGVGKNIPVDILDVYWPLRLAPYARKWVTGKLSGGIANSATLKMGIKIPIKLADNGKRDKPKLDKLSGRIDFKNVITDYLNPMPAVKNTNGFAIYGKEDFKITVNSGNVLDMKLLKAQIDLFGLGIGQNRRMNINLGLSGKLQSALKIINSKPLNFMKDAPFKISDVSGNGDINLFLALPIQKKLNRNDFKLKLSGDVANVRVKNVLPDIDLSNSKLKLNIDMDKIDIAGFGDIDGVGSKINWSKSFKNNSETATIKTKLDKKLFKKFKLDEIVEIKGVMDADLKYSKSNKSAPKVIVSGDLSNISLYAPVYNYQKKIGEKGSVSLTAHLNNGRINKISDMNLLSNNLHIKGDIEFTHGKNGQTNLKKANLPVLKMGKTDVNLKLKSINSGKKLQIVMNGRQFDASPLFTDHNSYNANSNQVKKFAKAKPLVISANINKLITGNKNSINNTKLYLDRNEWEELDKLELDGDIGSGIVRLRYLPSQNGRGYSLALDSSDAGSTIEALGISSNIQGGKINIRANTLPVGNPKDLNGRVIITEFKMKRVPALMGLLNALSAPGLQDLISGKGNISFSSMKSNFKWTQARDGNNLFKLLELKSGRTSGSSLGITFEGIIDKMVGRVRLDGTIVPLSGLNKAMGDIPIIGEILGGGDGLFAATYKIRGVGDDLKITVNPLAALAPGIFRKMFFEN